MGETGFASGRTDVYHNTDDMKNAYVSSDERKWINRIHKLQEERPDDVRILKEPKDNDGCIYAVIPFSYVRLVAPQKRTLTEEEKAARVAALNAWRESRKNGTL